MPLHLLRRVRALWVGLLVVGVLCRLALAALTEPYADEAYYWLWSERLAAGYYDHPPLLAFLLRGFGSIRLTAVVLGFLTVGALGGLARSLHRADPLAPVRAMALGAVLPAGIIAGTVATPDTPLHLFWVLALWAALGRQPALAGAALGLALLSKYTAVLLVPSVAVALWVGGGTRAVLVAGAVATAVFSPVVAWNARNGWESFAFQLRHGLGGASSQRHLLEFVAGQLAMGGPVLLPLGLLALGRPGTPAGLRLAVWLPVFAFGLAALRSRQEANWPAMVYPVLCAVCARGGRVAGAAGVVSAALALAGTVYLVAPPDFAPSGPMLARFHGWRALEPLRSSSARAAFAPSYQLAAQVRLRTGLPAGVAGEHRRSQLDLWPQPALAEGDDALWISEGDPVPAALAARFARVDPARVLEGSFRGRPLHRFEVVLLRGHRQSTLAQHGRRGQPRPAHRVLAPEHEPELERGARGQLSGELPQNDQPALNRLRLTLQAKWLRRSWELPQAHGPSVMGPTAVISCQYPGSS